MYSRNAIEKVFIGDAFKSGLANHVSKHLLTRKLPNGFDQVLVRFPVTREQLAHHGDNLK